MKVQIKLIRSLKMQNYRMIQEDNAGSRSSRHILRYSLGITMIKVVVRDIERARFGTRNEFIEVTGVHAVRSLFGEIDSTFIKRYLLQKLENPLRLLSLMMQERSQGTEQRIDRKPERKT